MRRGFTLIELLVVIAIIAVLIGLILPAVQKVRAAAARAKCANHLKQLALAAHNYESGEGYLPPGLEVGGNRPGSLFVHLLPYLEHEALHRIWDFQNPNNNFLPAPPRASVILSVLLCPVDPIELNPFPSSGGRSAALTSYGGNGGTYAFRPVNAKLDGLFHLTGPQSEPSPNQSRVRLLEITDGTSRTIMFGERLHGDANMDSYLNVTFSPPADIPFQASVSYGIWAPVVPNGIADVTLSGRASINYTYPQPYIPPPPPAPPVPVDGQAHQAKVELRLAAYGSRHFGGANFVFADGSVRFLPESLPLTTLQAFSTRAGYEVVAD